MKTNWIGWKNEFLAGVFTWNVTNVSKGCLFAFNLTAWVIKKVMKLVSARVALAQQHCQCCSKNLDFEVVHQSFKLSVNFNKPVKSYSFLDKSAELGCFSFSWKLFRNFSFEVKIAWSQISKDGWSFKKLDMTFWQKAFYAQVDWTWLGTSKWSKKCF